jgi:FtsP/CotA-like multicopper oxidase with cupredoxin domain
MLRHKMPALAGLALLCCLSSLPVVAASLSRPALDVVDVNADPKIFEAHLSADEQDVSIGGTTVHALIYKDLNNPGAYAGVPSGIPVPQIVVNVGDEVIVTLTNNLSPCGTCNTSIHWHGLELDNDSDGTGVTQNRLAPGESYTYRFRAPRPGVFWFHPHMKPGPQTFAGVYGAFIVKDPREATLQADGKIPVAANTHTLVLSDTEFDATGNVGYLDAGTAVPWATLKNSCEAGTLADCQKIKDGATVLVNGQTSTAGAPLITAKSGAGIRLRLVNVATNRYFRLKVTNNGSDNKLYRIGGEGGFLNQVRLEGGMQGSWDTKYASGEIVLPASGRSDVVVVPTGVDGDVITITDPGYARGGPSNNDPGGDLLHIKIDNSLLDASFSIAAGNDVLGAGGVEDLKGVAITDFYTNPPPMLGGPGSGAGSSNMTITLNSVGTGMTAIDGVVGEFEDSGADYSMVPYQNSSRYAKTGDTLEFTITNGTMTQHHPFHHHGFSFQPVRIVNNADNAILYSFNYDEFIDVIDVFDGQSVVVRMRLDDRPRITDTRQEAAAPPPDQFFASGGAAGRWVFHCHLFLHAAVGMISELVVLDTDRDGDGFDTSQDCNDFDTSINPSATEICEDGIDNNCNGIVDLDCNHPPIAEAGIDQGAECASHSGSLLHLDGTASSDPDGDTITYAWSAPGVVFDDATSPTPSATFPLGSTVVTLTVSDGSLQDTDEVVVTVVDTTPPDINASVSPSVLWPPNHKLVDIQAMVLVSDICDPNPSFALTSLTSNEPDNGKGDGNTSNDIQGAALGTPDTAFQLRSERSGSGNGRSYSIAYQATDASLQTKNANASVSVPKSQGKP